MSTISTFVTGTQPKIDVKGRKIYAFNELDFSATSVLAADVVQAIKIPAGSVVTNVRVLILTAEGGTCTATVGDGDSATGWDASVDINATSGTITAGIPGTDSYATAGKYYAAEDTIDLVMGHNTDAAKIRVFAELMQSV